MHLSGSTGHPVDGHHVLWTGREGDHTIQFSAQQHVVFWLAYRWLEGQAAIGLHRNVHEEVPRRWCLRRLQAQFGERRGEIVGAVVMVCRAAEQGVAIAVAGSDQGIVDPGRGILDEGEDGTALVCDQTVLNVYSDPSQGGTRMLHGHTLPEIGAVKGPGVDDLLSV